MAVSLDKVKQLREETQAGIVECKNALDKADGDIAEAKKILRKKGLKLAEKKSGKQTNQGIIASYVHHNRRVGTLVEVQCQSDFVARNQEFVEFAQQVAMHVAAFDPSWVAPEDVPEADLKEEEAVLRSQAEREGKPAHIVDKIIEGRMKKFYQRYCLLNQAFLKDEEKTVGDVVRELVARVGENIRISRFIRFELQGLREDSSE